LNIVIKVERNGDHYRSHKSAERDFKAAADYLRNFLREAGIEGAFTFIPTRSARWHGDPIPRVKVRGSDVRSVFLTVKPNGNDSVWEYSLVPSNGVKPCVISHQLVRAIDRVRKGQSASMDHAPVSRLAVAPPLPAAVAADPEPDPPRVVKPVPQTPAVVVQKITLLHKATERLAGRRDRQAKIQAERERIQALLASLDAEEERLEEEFAGDKEAAEAEELLLTIGELIG